MWSQTLFKHPRKCSVFSNVQLNLVAKGRRENVTFWPGKTANVSIMEKWIANWSITFIVHHYFRIFQGRPWLTNCKGALLSLSSMALQFFSWQQPERGASSWCERAAARSRWMRAFGQPNMPTINPIFTPSVQIFSINKQRVRSHSSRFSFGSFESSAKVGFDVWVFWGFFLWNRTTWARLTRHLHFHCLFRDTF